MVKNQQKIDNKATAEANLWIISVPNYTIWIIEAMLLIFGWKKESVWMVQPPTALKCGLASAFPWLQIEEYILKEAESTPPRFLAKLN